MIKEKILVEVQYPIESLPPLVDPLDTLRNRTPEEIAEDRKRILAHARKARPLPPGKTLEEVIVGALADDKSEEEIRTALAELTR